MPKVEGVSVACPMGLEFRAVAGLLEEAEELRLASRHLVSGRLGGVPVTVCRTGWGKAMAASSAQLLIDRWPGRLLLDAGTCGSLSGRLEVGDLLLAERAADGDFLESARLARYAELQAVPAGRPAQVAGELASRIGRSVVLGGVLCCDRTVDSLEERDRWQALGFDAACWETFSFLKVAEVNGVPALSLRVVSDRADGAVVETFRAHQESFLARLAEAVRVLVSLVGRAEEVDWWYWQHPQAK